MGDACVVVVAASAISCVATGLPHPQRLASPAPVVEVAASATLPKAVEPPPQTVEQPASRERARRIGPEPPPLVDHGPIDGFADLRPPWWWKPPPPPPVWPQIRSRALRRQLLACIESNVQRRSPVSGAITVRLTIDPEGKVSQVTSTHDPPFAAAAACIRRAAMRLRFPPRGKPAEVTIPIKIVAP